MSENEQNELRMDSSTKADEESRSNMDVMPDADQWMAERSSEASEGVPMAFSTTPDEPSEADQPIEEEPSPENQLPPEAQGGANGGPLGCCLGVMIGLLLSLSLAVLSRVYAGPLGSLLQGNYGLLGLIVRILMGILAVVFAILCGYFGWKVGKRIYREYDPPVAKERRRRARVKKA